VSANVKRVGCVASGGKCLGELVHATTLSGGSVHEYDTAFRRPRCRRVRTKCEPCPIASLEAT
jgi:hypothetical protein